MPELPDITVYAERIDALARAKLLKTLRIQSPFVLRTAVPPSSALHGKRLLSTGRMGKRIVLSFEEHLHAVIHLMRAGRLKWRAARERGAARGALAVFEFESGDLALTEAGTKRRASIHVVQGEDALHALDPGGLEVLESSLAQFRAQLRLENHTLKRALTEPKLFSGIGNAYSDEILHHAKLAPTALTKDLSDAAVATLFDATRVVLNEWTARLRAEAANGFPEKVTAFREGMAVHGRFGQRCPVCGTPVQRIVYAESETNYCPTCQTGGKVLADRALSRLLKSSWPKNVDDLE